MYMLGEYDNVHHGWYDVWPLQVPQYSSLASTIEYILGSFKVCTFGGYHSIDLLRVLLCSSLVIAIMCTSDEYQSVHL